MAKARRKQCSTKGCRKGRAEGEEYCADCLAAASGNGVSSGNGENTQPPTEDPIFAEDHVAKLTESELDRFNLLRLKMEHTLQAIRVLELEQDRANREYVSQKHQREQLIAQRRAEVEPANNVYLAFVRELAEKYKLQYDKMGIDDETGILRDLRPTQEGAEP